MNAGASGGLQGNGNSGSLLNGQQSKNDIIAKYMKSMNSSGNNGMTQSAAGIQKGRQQSSGL